MNSFQQPLRRDTPCIYNADDRARRLMHHRTLCMCGADDRAHRLQTHRTPCTESVYDRARKLIPHRTPCSYSGYDRARTCGTPCTSSGTSPRARTAPLLEGLSSASCPSSSPLLSASRRHWYRRYPELGSSPSDAKPSSSSFLRAPHKVPFRKRAQIFLVKLFRLTRHCTISQTLRKS